MSYMPKIMTGMLLALTSIATSSIAQERSAAGALDTQMTWTALSSQVAAANAKSDAVNTRVDQIVICARKGKVYAPAPQAGIDSQGCLTPASDFTAINATINNLTTNLGATTTTLNNVLVCNNKSMVYAPSAAGKDAQGCVKSGGGMNVGSVITSINGSKGFPPNTDLIAASDIFVSASSYGGGGESCPVGGIVNGVSVASDYAIRYASSVSFMVPKGAKWQVNAAGGNCGNRQVNVSVLPLN